MVKNMLSDNNNIDMHVFLIHNDVTFINNMTTRILHDSYHL